MSRFDDLNRARRTAADIGPLARAKDRTTLANSVFSRVPLSTLEQLIKKAPELDALMGRAEPHLVRCDEMSLATHPFVAIHDYEGAPAQSRNGVSYYMVELLRGPALVPADTLVAWS